MTSPYSAARWHAPVATTGLWALAAGAAVFWGLRLAAPPEPVAAAATMPQASVSAEADAVARLLGVMPANEAAPAAPEAASRFALSGVVADPFNQGAALISIDGKPPRPFRVGSQVGDNYVLQSVGVRAATLGASAQGPAAFTLQLPVRAPISVGSPAASGVPASPTPTARPSGLFPATVPPVVAPSAGGTAPPQAPSSPPPGSVQQPSAQPEQQ
ncbi:type II secretion system protein N [Variovorax paradoxus]|uniref:type II secretion system protein N n=1 Tax=Variovorax paradoxus TaxID=34073 RepID=UPI002780235B|nr:type II secretion system protein N [Variovorax paradoxus]MDQ0587455.1 general secretion pathway protein C [Variovorax paradoxus]